MKAKAGWPLVQNIKAMFQSSSGRNRKLIDCATNCMRAAELSSSDSNSGCSGGLLDHKCPGLDGILRRLELVLGAALFLSVARIIVPSVRH